MLISAVRREKEHLVLRRLEFAFDSVTWGKFLGFSEAVFQPVGLLGGGKVGWAVLALSFFTHTPGGAVTVLPS